MDENLVDVGIALIAFSAALIGSLIANLIAPTIEDRRQRKTIERQRKIAAIDSIYSWVREHLTSATLLYFAASERTEDWRSAVLRYEESVAAYTHTLAFARRLRRSIEVESGLAFLTTETEKMWKKYAWDVLHKKVSADDQEFKEEFNSVKEQAIRFASEIYELLDDEAIKQLGL